MNVFSSFQEGNIFFIVNVENDYFLFTNLFYLLMFVSYDTSAWIMYWFISPICLFTNLLEMDTFHLIRWPLLALQPNHWFNKKSVQQ